MRAQASLEFLVTYGWAIALTMATLSWLVYMGLNSPTTFAGESCKVSGEFGCEEAKLSTSSAASEASFVLRNLQSEKISVQEVILEYDSEEFTCTRFQNLDGSDLTFVRSGEEFEVLCDDENLFLPEGEKAKLSFTITYNKSEGFPRKASGEIVGLVDEEQAEMASCGDGIINDGEDCDDGVDNGVACPIPGYDGSCEYCSNSCETVILQGPYCGDGTRDVYQEQCDDGNTEDLDGCTTSCEYTQCSALVSEGGCTNTGNDVSKEIPRTAGDEHCKIQNDWDFAHCVACAEGYQWASNILECVEIPPECIAECESQGAVRCYDASTEQGCYDTNSDGCLEWVLTRYCAVEGSCVEGLGCPN